MRFLLPEKDPDLCEACALGKPTRDMAYTPQTRSPIKGALWYFDVSGGGDVTPSLKSNNRYILMFADSNTRMYFDYYTKRVDDKTIMRILKEFSEKHIVPLQRENNFLYSCALIMDNWIPTVCALIAARKVCSINIHILITSVCLVLLNVPSEASKT